MATKHITDIQVVQAQAEWKKNPRGKFAYEILEEQTGECQKVCYAAMQRAEKRGYLEYGVSLRTAWLTDKGKKLIGANDLWFCNECGHEFLEQDCASVEVSPDCEECFIACPECYANIGDFGIDALTHPDNR